jgi:hypothetical protein
VTPDRFRSFLTLSFLCVAALAHAQPPDSTDRESHGAAPSLRAGRVTGSIRVDGVLDEASWAAAEPATSFTQRDPEEGKPASEGTEVRVLVGPDALYVGARLLDREPSKIKSRLARRDDDVESDAFQVSIDSYHDHLTARLFRVCPSGALRDATIGSDGSEDDSWDAVWEARATIDGNGWTAEMRVPLSQLRYSSQEDAIMGIQLVRTIFRKGEASYFAFTPKKEQGGVNRYGHLVGLGRLGSPRRLELLPYTVARNERLLIPEQNPFRSSSDYFGAVGGDVKYGLTSDLTLDLTVNPDFGQVEVDPAEVNLTAFETFFPERRSFFVEGADLFAFGRSRAFNNFGVPTIFHSRRIGRQPQRVLAGPSFGFVDSPDQTTIAGAAKVTGRTAGGWSIGILDAVTTREEARFLDTLGVERDAIVEPLTHYFAGAAHKELRAGQTRVGGLVTAVNRDLADAALSPLLRSDAFLGGLDLAHAWANRRWALDLAVTGATVRGTSEAIAATQRSSSRYYQRPDHDDYATFDPTRTRLSGYGVDGSIAKRSGEHWLGSLAYVSRSPGYEANDLGFQTRADYRGFSSIVLYQQNKPNRWFRNWTAFPYANQMWNFGGDLVYNSYAFTWNGDLANYMPFGAFVTSNRSVLDDRQTRGGPQGRSPENGNWGFNLASDTRRSWSVGLNYTRSWNEAGGWGDFPSVSFSFRPSHALRLRFEPTYSKTHAKAQYVMAVSDPAAVSTYGRRYVFSDLIQSTASLVSRVDWTVSPKLSFQLYLQPLVVTGAYEQFKEFRAPGRFEFDVYGKHRGTIVRSPLGVYTVDPGNGSTFAFEDPDFNFRSLLGNAVIRWEYRPGSTLFVVWQQSRQAEERFGDFDFARDYREMLDHRPENVFAIKATYWIGL